ncbi:MAG TPA: long-chain-fatty-acid--CoA ligase, partial [Steroidobacteraceae bacterium]|nr:long-chain-fatty-acid--CoA ligase [Steroidobacteraceae bacterium]
VRSPRSAGLGRACGRSRAGFIEGVGRRRPRTLTDTDARGKDHDFLYSRAETRNAWNHGVSQSEVALDPWSGRVNMTTALRRALQQNPDRALTIFGPRTRTVRESADRIARLAGGLAALGVARGDRVAILALNSDRYHEYLLAVPWLGAVVNPCNIRWSAAELGYALRESETKVLLVDSAFAAMLPALREQWDGLETVVYCGDGAAPDGCVEYEQLIADASPILDVDCGPDDLYGVFFTGGTTGFAKGVMLSHRNMIASAMGSLATLDFVVRGGRLLHTAPMFHLADIATWNAGMMAGSTHVIVPSFTPSSVVGAIAEHHVTDVLLVPTMIQFLVDSPAIESADLSSLRGVVYGASPISAALLQRARKAFPAARFVQAYGMTELSPVATLLSPEDHDDPQLTGSCGRGAIHVEVRIVDSSGKEVPRGTVGEVLVRGENVMIGYWGRPGDSAEALRGGWMHTGDGGYMNDAGYVFIVDRMKDMIISGGENVYSVEVENALARHVAVAACAVIGIPDNQWGERVHAVVVLHPGAQLSVDELQESCRSHIAGYKVPRTVEFVDALPLSGAGKVLKRELRERHRSGTGSQIS